tara:strand:- start:11 stop:190 length:180 start_codon:yes stop_codon:yes gene_type:complete
VKFLRIAIYAALARAARSSIARRFEDVVTVTLERALVKCRRFGVAKGGCVLTGAAARLS